MYLEIFRNYIEENKLFSPSDKLLVAVSGGIDSVVLLWLLHQCKYSFEIAHCNFGLRQNESAQDELFVKKLAKKYNSPFHSKTFETHKYAQEHQLSIQMAARKLRYEWFYEMIDNENFSYILTAHHQNDSIETIIYNLIRGTGIAGLHGISIKTGKVVRPLLCFTKNDILDIASQNQLAWREDSSNAQNKYTRNLIRNEVIPVLKTINPNLENTLAQTTKQLRLFEIFLEAEYEKFKNTHCSTLSGIMYVKRDTAIHDALYLYLLKRHGFSFETSMNIIDNKTVGKTFNAEMYTLTIDRNRWCIAPKTTPETAHILIDANCNHFTFASISYSIEIVEKTQITHFEKNTAYLDFDKIHFPIQARPWTHGDRFVPLGMNGEKKISDFLVDYKVPIPQKKQCFVLVSNNQIICVSTLRVAESVKIDDNTKLVMLMCKKLK